MRTLRADYRVFSYPARKWKQRMQLSAPCFVEQLARLPVEERAFDTVLCSTFVDVAVLRALLSQLPGWNPRARFLTYFHENQCVYPNRQESPRSQTTPPYPFILINFNSALASDSVAFNSDFNRRSFLEGCSNFVRDAGDLQAGALIDRIAQKSLVLYPGCTLPPVIPEDWREAAHHPPVILWNHRWEHDKNPEEFFEALQALERSGLDFRVAVAGQSFATIPRCFAEAQRALQAAGTLLHFGYLPERESYTALLQQADIVVSTAHHEFFGIAVLEAVRAGCVPLLPERLSYPELFPAEYLYQPGQLFPRLHELVQRPSRLSAQQALDLTRRFEWSELAEAYRHWLGSERS
jgi:glycosyltransferase involved in cell wall biosynthesis